MTFLNRIIADKFKEIELKKAVLSISELERTALFTRKTTSLIEKLHESSNGIIGEYKRRLPTLSNNSPLNCFEVITFYETAGICAVSVVTDTKYFGGSSDDFLVARACTQLPMLRNDFIITEYQIYESKSLGADAIILIEKTLTPNEIKTLYAVAKSIDLEILIEIDSIDSLHTVLENNVIPNAFVVTNRNYETFETNFSVSNSLIREIPEKFTKIAAHGITSPETVKKLKENGVQGFIVGSHLMKDEFVLPRTKQFVESISQ